MSTFASCRYRASWTPRPVSVLLLVAVIVAATAARPAKRAVRVGNGTVAEDTRFEAIRSIFQVPGSFLERNVDMAKVHEHAAIVFSEDRLFVVKACSRADWISLHSKLDAYHAYLKQHSNSMLPRFLSAFKMKGTKKKVQRWVVMYNWLRPAVSEYQRVYDLKGSEGSASAGDRLVRINMDDISMPTLKDLNFAQGDQVIHVPAELRGGLLRQLEKDVGFLQRLRLIDYSLILSVSRVGVCDLSVLSNVCDSSHVGPKGLLRALHQRDNGYMVGVRDGESMAYVYSFGLIDILHDYTLKARTADRLKKLAGEKGIIDSKTYGERFLRYTDGIFLSDARHITAAECGLAGLGGEEEGTDECKLVALPPLEEPVVSDDDESVEPLWFHGAWPTSVVMGLAGALVLVLTLLIQTLVAACKSYMTLSQALQSASQEQELTPISVAGPARVQERLGGTPNPFMMGPPARAPFAAASPAAVQGMPGATAHLGRGPQPASGYGHQARPWL